MLPSSVAQPEWKNEKRWRGKKKILLEWNVDNSLKVAFGDLAQQYVWKVSHILPQFQKDHSFHLAITELSFLCTHKRGLEQKRPAGGLKSTLSRSDTADTITAPCCFYLRTFYTHTHTERDRLQVYACFTFSGLEHSCKKATLTNGQMSDSRRANSRHRWSCWRMLDPSGLFSSQLHGRQQLKRSLGAPGSGATSVSITAVA